MIKLFILCKLFLFQTSNCDSCLSSRVERCITDEGLPIIIPVIIEKKYYQLITPTRCLKEYLIEIDSTYSNNKKLRDYFLSCYMGNDTLYIDWNRYKKNLADQTAYIALLIPSKKISTKQISVKYGSKEKISYLNKMATMINSKPYPSFKGKLWQIKLDYNLSKEDIFTLFTYNVLFVKGDGRNYLVDICN